MHLPHSLISPALRLAASIGFSSVAVMLCAAPAPSLAAELMVEQCSVGSGDPIRLFSVINLNLCGAGDSLKGLPSDAKVMMAVCASAPKEIYGTGEFNGLVGLECVIAPGAKRAVDGKTIAWRDHPRFLAGDPDNLFLDSLMKSRAPAAGH